MRPRRPRAGTPRPRPRTAPPGRGTTGWHAHRADLLGGGGPAQADALFQLSKEAFRHHVIDGLWRVRAATSATSLGTVITSDPVIGQIRKELRRRTGHDVDPAELSDLIRSSVLRPADTRHRPRRPTTVVCGIPVGRMEDLAG